MVIFHKQIALVNPVINLNARLQNHILRAADRFSLLPRAQTFVRAGTGKEFWDWRSSAQEIYSRCTSKRTGGVRLLPANFWPQSPEKHWHPARGFCKPFFAQVENSKIWALAPIQKRQEKNNPEQSDHWSHWKRLQKQFHKPSPSHHHFYSWYVYHSQN